MPDESLSPSKAARLVGNTGPQPHEVIRDDEVIDDRLDSRLPRRDRSRCERAGHEHPEPRVGRRIPVDQRSQQNVDGLDDVSRVHVALSEMAELLMGAGLALQGGVVQGLLGFGIARDHPRVVGAPVHGFEVTEPLEHRVRIREQRWIGEEGRKVARGLREFVTLIKARHDVNLHCLRSSVTTGPVSLTQ